MNNDQLNVNTVVGSGYFEGYACWSSYGSNSPGLDYDDYYAYFVSSGGGVDNYSNADWDSCGIIYFSQYIISMIYQVIDISLFFLWRLES